MISAVERAQFHDPSSIMISRLHIGSRFIHELPFAGCEHHLGIIFG